MIKEKEVYLSKSNNYAKLYEFPKYMFWKPKALTANKVKHCKVSFLLDLLFGVPTANFNPIKDQDILVIDNNGHHWQVEHGYLNVTYADIFRLNRVKTVIGITSVEDGTQYFVGVSLAMHLGYAESVDKFKYEDAPWSA